MSLSRLRPKNLSISVAMAELVELLQDNTPESLEKVFTIATQEKIVALDDDEAWNNLDFLAFDDSLAEKARRERARAQKS